MYDQKLEFQSGSSTRGGGGGTDRPTDRCGELPHVKLMMFADGKVRPVDENGKPLGIYTDNSAIHKQQGYQTIQEKYKLLHIARK